MVAKLDFFIEAMKAQMYCRKDWVLSAFALIDEDANEWKKVRYPYAYRIVKTGDKYSYVSPLDNSQLILIDDSDSSKPLIYNKDKIRIGYTAAANLPPVKEMVETTYGNLFFNYIALIYAFGNKIPYQHGRVSASTIETIIASKLQDNPAEGEERQPDVIYVDEYLKFTNAMFSLSGFTQLWVPGATEKTLTCSPDLEAFKQKLLNEYKDQLHDPAIVAKIEAELVKFDKENWLAGDRGLDFLIKKKSTDIVRKKLFLMYGVEQGLTDKIEVNPITRSLAQGWDVEKFPDMNNALRAGSFNRGAQTMLGGESVKWLLRASSNIRVAEDDCKTKLGIPFVVTEVNNKQLIGRYVVGQTEPILVTEETHKQYLGKTVVLRSPMFCKLDKTDFCAKCVGAHLGDHPTGLSIAVADYGSAFLDVFLAMMHGKKLETAKLQLSSFK